jgi:single-strand DNA-binding protein
MNLNVVVIGGNLTADPELRYTPNGSAVCEFTVAINKKWTDKATGQQKEDVSFIGCVAWNKTAEMVAEYFKKGRGIVVQGELKQDRWESPDGKKQSKTKVTANRIDFVGPKAGGTAPEPLVVPDPAEEVGP